MRGRGGQTQGQMRKRRTKESKRDSVGERGNEKEREYEKIRESE